MSKVSAVESLFQVHRGIKGVVRDKDTEAGIADAIIKVDDIDHHIRSGEVLHFSCYCVFWVVPGFYRVCWVLPGFYRVC